MSGNAYESSTVILSRFQQKLGKEINLVLSPAYLALLDKLGAPHLHLPPVFHVAGTNGKGSTCAFLRAALEAAGKRVHVYTSPHLVRFHERIRVAGALIDEETLVGLLHEVEAAATPGTISLFEAATAAAFLAFARTPADFCILEVGLGGRLDATNVVPRPLATLIARLSFDHREFLGDTLAQIAREKAGILRAKVPCFAAAQPNPGAADVLQAEADRIGTPLYLGGRDWRIGQNPRGFALFPPHNAVPLSLPLPSLPGAHQYENAGLAMVALSVLSPPLAPEFLARGVAEARWPARLQKLSPAALGLPGAAEVWLDGGHNDSAGEALAAQIAAWRARDGASQRPLYVLSGMIATKRPEEFLAPFAAEIAALRAVAPASEHAFIPAATLAETARRLGIADARPALFQSADDFFAALASFPAHPAPRFLICGSLYLAGAVLTALENQANHL